jgi:hypothetical protein
MGTRSLNPKHFLAAVYQFIQVCPLNKDLLLSESHEGQPTGPYQVSHAPISQARILASLFDTHKPWALRIVNPCLRRRALTDKGFRILMTTL